MPLLTSSRLGLPFLAAGQAQKELTHNEAIALIDIALHSAVESAVQSAPPSDPMQGACWIVGALPTGAWADQAGALACWTESGWRFVVATDGMRVWVGDQKLWATHRTGDWVIGQEQVSSLIVGAEQVVGPREPAVTGPSGGTTIDAEARAAIDDIIARLVAHGLIGA